MSGTSAWGALQNPSLGILLVSGCPRQGGAASPPPHHRPHRITPIPPAGVPALYPSPPAPKIPVRRKVLTCREEEEGEEEAAAVAHGTGGGGSRGGRDAPPGPVARPPPPPRSGPPLPARRCRRPPRSSAGRTAAPAGTGDRGYRASVVVSGTGRRVPGTWAVRTGRGRWDWVVALVVPMQSALG